MCGRLVNLDTVARVIADYYHLKTETQLAALDEALSKVPAVSVGGGHGKDHIGDPGKMVGDLISRAAALDALAEWHDPAITNRLNNLPSAQSVEDASAMCGECDAWNQYKNYLQPGWIPCKTALPEKGKYVLCQCRAGIMDVLRLTDDNDWYKDSTHIYMYGFVVAWMPLPAPWKEGKE